VRTAATIHARLCGGSKALAAHAKSGDPAPGPVADLAREFRREMLMPTICAISTCASAKYTLKLGW
jgi:hypothetical protein